MSAFSNKAPHSLDIALGAAVKTRRISLGFSQEALADQCGVTFQQIQKYESGANRISFSRLVQIARALKCRVVDLTEALDGGEGDADADLDLLKRMRVPGAEDLLSAFEQMGPEARASLLNLVRTLKGSAAIHSLG